MLTKKSPDGKRRVVGRGHSRGKPETTEYLKMVARMIRNAGKRVADADEVDLAQMLTMQDELNRAIVAAVHGQRTKWDRSWAYIAEGAGMTRQAAQQRWGKAVTELAEKLAEDNEPEKPEKLECRMNDCTRTPIEGDNLCAECKADMIARCTETYPPEHSSLTSIEAAMLNALTQ